MKRKWTAPPEEFAQSPLLAILPQIGNPGALPELTSSLYARFENVSEILRNLSSEDMDVRNRLQSEEAMLKRVLEWLDVTPEGEL